MFNPFPVITSLLCATRVHLANREIQEISRIKEEIDKIIRVEEQRQQLEVEILNLNVYQKIDLHGMPYSIEKIEELLDNEPNFNINYLDKNGKSLLDKVINLASNNKIVIRVFNRIINNQNISNNTLLNSLQHINEYIVRLPKNKTRPKLKVLLESKLR